MRKTLLFFRGLSVFGKVNTEMRLDYMEEAVKKAVKQIRDELDDHLDTINQNTEELSSAYQYIAELEGKIEKLSERLDEITYSGAAQELIGGMEIDLSLKEQEIFSCLYHYPQGLTVEQVTRLTGFTQPVINTVIDTLGEKGVPVHKHITGLGKSFQLEHKFRDLQARKQLVTVHPSIAGQFTQIKN